MKRLSGEKNRSKRKGWEQVGYLYKMHQHTPCQIQYLGDLSVWVSGIWVISGTVSMCGCQHLGHLNSIIRDSSGAFFFIWVISVAFLSGSAQGHSSYLGHLRGILIRVSSGAFFLSRSAQGHSSSLDHLRGILIRVSSGAFVLSFFLSGSAQGHSSYLGHLRGILIRVNSGAFFLLGSAQGHSSSLDRIRGILIRVSSGALVLSGSSQGHPYQGQLRGILLTWVISGAFVSGSSQGHSYLVHLRGILIWVISGAFLSGSASDQHRPVRIWVCSGSASANDQPRSVSGSA